MDERLARGDKGVNGLDELCKTHDIAYATHKDSAERYKADKELSKGAVKRIFAKDSSLGERAAALFVTSAMKAKTGLSKFGMGFSKSKKGKCSKTIKFETLVKDVRSGIKRAKAKTIGATIQAALRSAKKAKKGRRIKIPRIIKVPKITGGILPILPIIAGLSAVGSLIGSTASVVKTMKYIKNSKDHLLEQARHNRALEQKVGHGLYLGTQKKGRGLYLRPHRAGAGFYYNSKNYH